MLQEGRNFIFFHLPIGGIILSGLLQLHFQTVSFQPIRYGFSLSKRCHFTL